MFTGTLDTMAGDPEKHHIARGTLLDVRETRGFTQARYDIKEVIFGEIPQEIIEVGFYPMALKGDLPVEAVLILGSRFKEGPPYSALGADPAVGILPDTPENRARARSLTEEDMNRGNPAEKQISETKARSVVEQFLAEKNLLGRGILEFWRSPYGWRASWDSDSYPAILFYVGDDGGLKCANHSGGVEVKPFPEEDRPEALPGWPAGSYRIKEKKFDYVVLRAALENTEFSRDTKAIKYRVLEVLNGEMDAGVDVVQIGYAMDFVVKMMKGEPVAADFPQEAILIVTHNPKLGKYVPLDLLASRGILPATPENIMRVKTSSPESLLGNPEEQRLSLSEAQTIAKHYLSEQKQWSEKAPWTIIRMGFGWVFSSSTGRSGCELYVGDDGEVKYLFDVQKSIELR